MTDKVQGKSRSVKGLIEKEFIKIDEFDLDPDREWSCPPPRRDVWEVRANEEDVDDL
jgi:hypothetical protein